MTATMKRPEDTLTPREREVIALVAEGYDNQGIASALGIAIDTVKAHVYRSCNKVGASNRVELANFAWREERARYEARIAELAQQVA